MQVTLQLLACMWETAKIAVYKNNYNSLLLYAYCIILKETWQQWRDDWMDDRVLTRTRSSHAFYNIATFHTTIMYASLYNCHSVHVQKLLCELIILVLDQFWFLVFCFGLWFSVLVFGSWFWSLALRFGFWFSVLVFDSCMVLIFGSWFWFLVLSFVFFVLDLV